MFMVTHVEGVHFKSGEKTYSEAGHSDALPRFWSWVLFATSKVLQFAFFELKRKTGLAIK